MALTIFRSPAAEIQVDGGTVYNYGPDVLYYRDEQPVSASVKDGTIASGANVTLLGSQFMVSAGRSSIDIVSSATAQSSANSRVLLWDAGAGDYVPAAYRADTSQPREFIGPVDPSTLDSVTGPVFGDEWTPSEEPVA